MPRQPSGNCLVDPHTGEITAADAQLLGWLSACQNRPKPNRIEDLAPGLASKLALLSSEEAFPVTLESMVTGPEGELPARFRVNRLQGIQQDLLLVEISEIPPDLAGQWPVDAVTGLPDRRALTFHRARWLEPSARPAIPHAVLFLDLNGFKQVNDKHGHAVGDQVLAELADRWRACVRDDDLVVRYGGDEFVVLLGQIGDHRDVAPIVGRLESASQKPIKVGKELLSVTVTIGVALSGVTPGPLEELLVQADRDMYAAKAKLQAD